MHKATEKERKGGEEGKQKKERKLTMKGRSSEERNDLHERNDTRKGKNEGKTWRRDMRIFPLGLAVVPPRSIGAAARPLGPSDGFAAALVRTDGAVIEGQIRRYLWEPGSIMGSDVGDEPFSTEPGPTATHMQPRRGCSAGRG